MFKGTKLFMTALYVCSTLGCMGAYAAQRNVVAARNTTAQRSSVARATQSPRAVAPRAATQQAVAPRAAVKTTTARAAANTVQSRAVAGPEKNISSRRGTQNRTTQARAGTTQTGVVLRSGAVESNLPIVKLYVDNSIINQYANLKKYVELSGDDGFVKLVNTGTLPNMSTVFRKLSENNTSVSGVSTDADGVNLVTDENGAFTSDATSADSDLHLIASVNETEIEERKYTVRFICSSSKGGTSPKSITVGYNETFTFPELNDGCRHLDIEEFDEWLCDDDELPGHEFYPGHHNAGEIATYIWTQNIRCMTRWKAVAGACQENNARPAGCTILHANNKGLGGCVIEGCACNSGDYPDRENKICITACAGFVGDAYTPTNGCADGANNSNCVAKYCGCASGYHVSDGACVVDDIQTTDCPSIDESLAKYENASANISNGRLLSAPDGETISNQSACTWIFTDGDGMCRIGTYTYRPSSTTYYDWNGSIVACNTTTIGNDHGFDVDVGPIMDTVPTAFWDLDYLRLEDRLTYRYDTTLPSLKPYVDAAKGGTISGHYTFKGGYVGDSCSVTYSNGVPSVGSGCTRVYDDSGNPVKTLSSSDSDELTLAWDYSDNSRANYASICPTTRAEYNKIFNTNGPHKYDEDLVSASCTVQRALVTSNNSIISPASDCAILCEDTLDVCYAKILNNNAGSSTGMVSCDTTGYVDTTKSVRILDDGSEGDAVNTVRYRTYLKDYAIRSGEHTIIFVQPSNTWPSVSNLIADLYHCGGANSHDGCTNGDDGKTFRGIYTEPNCAGTQIYDQNGDYNTSTSVTYEDLPAVAWGDNHKKVYMCWLDPSTQLNPVSNCPRFDLNVQGSSWNGITPTKYVRAENEGDRKSDNTDCAIIYEDADGFCRIAPYKVQPAYQGLPAISVYTDSIYKGDGKWNISSPRGGPVVDCDKEYSDIDEELLVLTNAGGIKSNYDDRQSLLFNQLYVGIEYGKKLPSLAPLVNMNKYYLPNAVLVGGYSKNHMSAGGQPCAGISAGGCVSLPESEKYWDADGEPVKTIASETELKNNFDGHDGLYEPSLLWNTANVTVADCPVPDGLSCADENEACDLSGRKTYPTWWMPKNVGTLSYVRSEFLFNVYGAIADCGVILKDENGTCWAVRNYRSCTAGETTCAPNQVECGE